MRVAVANQKGGVGKTTTAVNLATALALDGYRVLLVDLDPQANASTGVGVDHRQVDTSVYDVLIADVPAREALRRTDYAGLDLLPSSIDLAGAELELVSALARESKLRRALEPLDAEFDLVLVDCPPSLGLLTVNALTAADELLVPIQCEYYALEGVTQLLRNIELVRDGLNPGLEVGGIVLTMFDARTKLSEQVADEVRRHFGDRVYRTVIPRSVRLSEAPSYGQPAVVFDASSRGAQAYTWLAREFADRHAFARRSVDGDETGPAQGVAEDAGGLEGVPAAHESRGAPHLDGADDHGSRPAADGPPTPPPASGSGAHGEWAASEGEGGRDAGPPSSRPSSRMESPVGARSDDVLEAPVARTQGDARHAGAHDGVHGAASLDGVHGAASHDGVHGADMGDGALTQDGHEHARDPDRGDAAGHDPAAAGGQGA